MYLKVMTLSVINTNINDTKFLQDSQSYIASKAAKLIKTAVKIPYYLQHAHT